MRGAELGGFGGADDGNRVWVREGHRLQPLRFGTKYIANGARGGATADAPRIGPVQGRHCRDARHQKSRGPARCRIARPHNNNHRPQWPYQSARPWRNLAVAGGGAVRWRHRDQQAAADRKTALRQPETGAIAGSTDATAAPYECAFGTESGSLSIQGSLIASQS